MIAVVAVDAGEVTSIEVEEGQMALNKVLIAIESVSISKEEEILSSS